MGQGVTLRRLSNYFYNYRPQTAFLILIVTVLYSSTFVLAQASVPASTAAQHARIIVKLKTSLAQAAEAEFSATTPPGQMQIVPGKAKGPRVQGFMKQYAAQQLAPMYPGIVHVKKQHGWSDAQFADHIRQRFPARTRRRGQVVALPELSRTYVLDLGSVTDGQKNRTVQLLKRDANIEFAEPAHSYSTRQVTNDPFLSSSGSWGQPYADLWGLQAIGAPAGTLPLEAEL